MARTAYFDHPAPIAMAHRGFSVDGHENTLAAFEQAVDLGFAYVETDVHVTSDGMLVAFHDDTLDRVTDAQGLIRELPWSTVELARIGDHPVPRLDDVLDAWPALRLNIDCKHISAAETLADTIEKHAAHDRWRPRAARVGLAPLCWPQRPGSHRWRAEHSARSTLCRSPITMVG